MQLKMKDIIKSERDSQNKNTVRNERYSYK